MFYLSLKYLIRYALGVFFRKVKIEGVDNIPKDVPLLIIANHQNALIDALIVGSFFPRSVHFLTRQDVFNPKTERILKALKMMPVYRIRDGYSQLKNNDGVFNACFELFKQNESVLIFPEGNHGEHHYLRPLTKGAARLAFQSDEAGSKSLMVLPVGINYFDHKKARSSLVLVYGKPITVADYREAYKENAAAGLKQLREAMKEGMKSTLVIPDHTDSYEEDKAFVFQEKNGGLGFEELKALAEVKDKTTPPARRNRRIMARVLNPAPFFLISHFLKGLKDIVFTSTTKFAVGLIAFPIWWLLVFSISALLFGTYIGLLVVFTMVTALFYSYQ